MNRTDLVEKVAEQLGEPKSRVERVLAAAEKSIVDAVASGQQVSLSGFVSFTPTVRKARNGVNPQTGEKIVIPETKTVSIKPSRKFKDTVK